MPITKRFIVFLVAGALCAGALCCFAGARLNAQDDDSDGPPDLPEPVSTAIDYSQMKFSHNLDNGSPAIALAFSPDGKRLAASVSRRVLNWNTTTWELQKPLASYATNATAVAFSPDGKLFASGCDGNQAQVQIVDLGTGGITQTITGLAPVTCVAFSPDSGVLAIATRAPLVQIVKCSDGSTVTNLKGSLYPAFKLLWTPDGSRLRTVGGGLRPGSVLAGGDDRNRQASNPYAADTEYLDWRLKDSKPLRQMTIADGGPSCDFSSDGKFVAYLSGTPLMGEPHAAQTTETAPQAWGGSGINVWRTPLDAEDPGKAYAAARMQTSPFRNPGWPSLAWSPDSRVVAAGDEQGEYLWDYTTGTAAFFTLPLVQRGLLSVQFSPDGRTLAGSDENSIFVWSLQ